MNSLVDDYLLYVSNTIASYSKVILKNDENIVLDKLTDIVYDYLNEVFLLNQKIGDFDFGHTLSLKLQDHENSLFNLFLQYGLIDRLKLKDKNIRKSYIFVVDTINYFINVEKYIYKNADFFYNQVSLKILKNQVFIDKNYLKEKLDSSENELEKLYKINCDSIKKINKQIDKFSYKVQSISNNEHFLNTLYKNDKLYDYKESETLYVLKDYQRDVYLNSLENLSINIVKELFENKKNKYFVFVPEYIANSKLALKKLLKIFNVYSVNKQVCFIFDWVSLNKHDYLDEMLTGYEYGVYLNNESNFEYNYENVNYMIIHYDEELEDIVNRYSKSCSIIITGRLNSNIKNKLREQNINKFCNIRVVTT